MFEHVANSFQPLIELAQGVSYPLAFFMFIVCGCQYIIGNEMQAKRVFRCSAIGYIIVQFAPTIMKILHTATQGLGK